MRVDHIIAEFRQIMLDGHCGDRELLLPVERDYSGMWSALCAKLTDWEARFGWDNPVVVELRREMHAVADQRPDAVQVFAMNTTEYGRQ